MRHRAMSTSNKTQVRAANQGLSFDGALRDSRAGGLLLFDGKSAIVGVSGRVEQVLGFNGGQVLNQPLQALPARLRTIIRQAATGKAVRNRRVTLALSGSETVSLRLSAIPTSPGKRNSGVALLIQEVSAA